MEAAKIYLDYNATTPVAPEVVEVVSHSLKDLWGNPSSSHEYGFKAKEAIAKSRNELAKMIGATSHEIIFTSGGTEANNMVIESITKLYTNAHIITTTLEHPSIKQPLEHVPESISVSYISAKEQSGCAVDVEDVISAIRPNTKLVSIMLANNETGVIQPIREIANAVKQLNPKILVHTDAAQAIGKIPVNVNNLNVDLLTIVGHKFYGPRNGALYIRSGCKILPLMYGGNQESTLRSGTENTPMIVGLGEAARLVNCNLKSYSTKYATVRDYMEEKLKELPNVIINGQSDVRERLPNTCNVSFLGFNGREILKKCQVTLASTGAACHSSETKVSSILLASGIPKERAAGAVRLSIGRETTFSDIDIVVKELKEIVSK